MNWKVRIKNKVFWISFIPMVLLLVKQVAGLCGYSIDVDGISEQLVAIAETVFAVLGIIGVCNDPTTAGLGDSNQAMTYTAPKE